ncbi:MAG: SRPBCC domain-containing protein [Terracidiphilus sp.]
MSPWVVTHSRVLSPDPELESCAERGRFSLSFLVSVEAVRDRIFQALTNAEYMETWLMIPHQRAGTAASVSSSLDGFYIQYQDEKLRLASITGFYETCRRGKILFTWNRADRVNIAPSRVEIRLHGNFSGTELSLVHAGLGSEEEVTWHRRLWEGSLQNMCRLLHRTACVSSDSAN